MQTLRNNVATRVSVRIAALAAICAVVAGCGGGGGGSGDNGPPPINGPAWGGFGRDAQHSALSGVATQALARKRWQTSVDLAPQYASNGALYAHYGSPIISSRNTVIVPVRTANGTARVEARAGSNGALLWSVDTDFPLPAGTTSFWTPSYNMALTPANRLYFAGAQGKIFYRDDVDAAGGTVNMVANLPSVAFADSATFTVDSTGTLFATVSGRLGLGFVVRVAMDGTVTAVNADELVPSFPLRSTFKYPAINSVPALSSDYTTLYVAINAQTGTGSRSTYLVALDAKTLTLKSRVQLVDPATGGVARVSDSSSASPTVGPDGDVYFGVIEGNAPAHNLRGWLLHYDATLSQTKTPASFGWDITASIVPSSTVSSYNGASSYLLAIKYNNYGGIGTGDGKNRMAIVDPTAVQTDPISGFPVMKEVITVLGPMPDPEHPGGVREWCINTAAVDPVTRSVLVNSEDGLLYRWSMVNNQLTEQISLGSPIGEAYTPTAVGPDGTVYAINNAILYAVGQ